MIGKACKNVLFSSECFHRDFFLIRMFSPGFFSDKKVIITITTSRFGDVTYCDDLSGMCNIWCDMTCSYKNVHCWDLFAKTVKFYSFQTSVSQY